MAAPLPNPDPVEPPLIEAFDGMDLMILIALDGHSLSENFLVSCTEQRWENIVSQFRCSEARSQSHASTLPTPIILPLPSTADPSTSYYRQGDKALDESDKFKSPV